MKNTFIIFISIYRDYKNVMFTYLTNSDYKQIDHRKMVLTLKNRNLCIKTKLTKYEVTYYIHLKKNIKYARIA